MYSVSEKYRATILKEVVADRIAGTVTLSDGTEITLSDQALVNGSLKITHELCESYKIGTFNLGCLQISIFDDNALQHDFSGAAVCPVYEILTDDGWESVPMGIYLADGNSVRRKRNVVSFTAYDRGILFERAILSDDRSFTGTAEEVIALACGRCGVTAGNIAEGLPNSSVTLSLGSVQAQTYRDAVAWCASLLCGYAVIGRDGRLNIIPASYEVREDDNTDIIIDKYLTSAERDSIYVTDTRAYIRTLNAYCGNYLKTYVSDVVQPDRQAAEAFYTLAKNPLIPSGLTPAEYDRINESWLHYIDGFKQRGINAEIYGDPAIDAGDVLRCSEGDIDQRRSIVGLVTKQEWRYRKFHTVICAAPKLAGLITENAAGTGSQVEKQIASQQGCYAGRGISANGNTFLLEPAQNLNTSDSSDAWETRLGGVCGSTYGGVEVKSGGRLQLTTMSYSDMGGAKLGSGLKINKDQGVTDYRLTVNLGKGLRFYFPHGAWQNDSRTREAITLRLGKGLRFSESDTIFDPDTEVPDQVTLKLGAGLGFSEVTDPADPDYGKVEVLLGDGLSVDSDGRINAEAVGYTAGNGISISGSTVSAKIGSGLEYDQNGALKVSSESGMLVENAVIIQEVDAAYLLHNYSQVNYIAGNKVGYAGAGNPIIVQGYTVYANGIAAPNGRIIGTDTAGNTSDSVPDVPVYAGMTFNPRAYLGYSDSWVTINDFDRLQLQLVRAYADRTDYKIALTAGSEEKASVEFTEYPGWSRLGFTFAYTNINPPSQSYPYGYVKAYLYACWKGKQAYADKYFFMRFDSNNRFKQEFTVPFASAAEYNAAVGLTYEPLTLTRIEDDPEIV